jgi:hypothetical protein
MDSVNVTGLLPSISPVLEKMLNVPMTWPSHGITRCSSEPLELSTIEATANAIKMQASRVFALRLRLRWTGIHAMSIGKVTKAK